MDMRMKVESLAPGVKDRQESDRRTEMLWIGRDGEQRFRYGAEQNPVDLARILQCQPADLLGQSKDDVEILYRQ